MNNFYILQPFDNNVIGYMALCEGITNDTKDKIIEQCISQIFSGTVIILNIKYNSDILSTDTYIQLNSNSFYKIEKKGTTYFSISKLLERYRKIDMSNIMADRNDEFENNDDEFLVT